jgi:hypothetical protein
MGAGAATGIYLLYKAGVPLWLSRVKDDLISDYAERTAERSRLPSDLLRSQFMATPLILRKPVQDHTHGLSAAMRSSGVSFLDEYAANVGLGVYTLQCSRADQRNGRAGSRNFHWAKDFTSEASPFSPPKGSLLTLIDVDYHVDMPTLLNDEFCPTALYTFTPDEVCRSDGEYSYTFDENNVLTYRVAGGGEYRHRVWSYGCDHIVVAKTFFGFPYQVSFYLVDKRQVDTDHALVLLTPLRRWCGLSAIFGWMMGGKQLERLEPVEGNFLRMQVQRKEGLFVSTGVVDEYICATLPVKLDGAISTAASTSTVKLSVPQILQYIDGEDLKEKKAVASALLKYYRFRNEDTIASRAIVYPVEESVRTYTFGVDSFDAAAKRTLDPFMSPLIHGAFAPSATLANEKQAVEGRVKSIMVKRGTLKVSGFLLNTMNEFVRFLIPEKGVMFPTTIDEVYERQGKPSQRAILNRSLVDGPKSGVKTFMKREAYQDVKDPRIISTFEPVVKREYSQFIYPVADSLKTQAWYAFGKPPVAIADRVVEVVKEANMAVNTDFSRFDGRVSDLLRMLERKVLLRAYGTEYTHEITELHESQFNQIATGTFGTRYETGTSRASGSAETAAFNSIANAFVAYLTFRMMREGGGFIAPQEAWERLGVYGGDDGLTADVDCEKYVKASEMLGLKLELDKVLRGEEGVTFLSRMYTPHVWFGETTSCCDLPRQLTKFHTTVVLPPNVQPIDKLVEKSRAFYLTDKNTPVLGELVCKVLTLRGREFLMEEGTAAMRAWNSDLPEYMQYPNEPHEWFDHYALRSLGDYGFDFELFRDWLSNVASLEDCLKPPLCAEPKEPEVKVLVVVDGDVKEPKVKKAESSLRARGSKSDGLKRGKPTGKPRRKPKGGDSSA